MVRTAWILSAAGAAMFLLSDVFLAGVYRYSWGYYPRYAWPSLFYLAVFFGLLDRAAAAAIAFACELISPRLFPICSQQEVADDGLPDEARGVHPWPEG
jgi:hypothetical protein